MLQLYGTHYWQAHFEAFLERTVAAYLGVKSLLARERESLIFNV